MNVNRQWLLASRPAGMVGTEKCAWLTGDARFDAAIDYQSEDVSARIGELCPDRVDVFFDNVGGGILEAALHHQEGFENVPRTLTRLFTGRNRGKQLLKLGDPV